MDPSRRRFLRSGVSVGGVLAGVLGRTGSGSAVARTGGGAVTGASMGGGMHARLPSLRERPEDIGALAAHFLRLAYSRLKRPEIRLTRQDIATLRQYDWPGNVRELQHVIERAVILAQGGRPASARSGSRTPPFRPTVR